MRVTVQLETLDGLRCDHSIECGPNEPLPVRIDRPTIRAVGPLTDEQAMRADVIAPMRHYQLSWSVPFHLRDRMPILGVYREFLLEGEKR